MPRPRVRPEDRQRATKACLPCKASKKRCDAQQPCSNCVRRRNPARCKYEEATYVGLHDTRPRDTASLQTRSESPARPSTNESNQHPRHRQRTPHPGDEHARLAGSTATSRRPSGGRLLLNAKGEKVYVGGTASLSFLQFLRRTIRQQMGPSSFTENSRRNQMLEVSSPEDTHINLEENPGQRRELIDVFLAASNGFLDLFSREELERYLDPNNIPSDSSRHYTIAAVDIAIAIGGQCRALGPQDLRYAVKCFSRAQKAALSGGLEDPCLDMVRCFLLMAFYMLGACRRNAAFLYVGVASQASSALGLHVTEQYRHFDVRDQSVRLRTLKSLRVLDVLVSSILGRPYSTPTIEINSVSFNSMHVNAAKPRDVALNASFGACSLLAEISQSLESESVLEQSAAERFLQRFHDWSSRLPSDIRQFTVADGSPLTLLEQEQIIGSIHVSCIYYFAVMLVTRPFLISHLMSRLPGATTQPSEALPTSTDQPEAVNLAQACVDSAVLMAQTCADALRKGILLNNMCIMKAWLFAAGLVLGFSMFAHGESPFDMDESFNGAREVLGKLGANSPLAAHYYDILTGLGEAIQRHRQHLSREKRKSSNRYVNQILSLDTDPATSDRGSPSTFFPRIPSNAESGSETPTAGGGSGDFDFQTAFQIPDPTEQPMDNSVDFDLRLFGWDDFAMQISENFSFDDSEPVW